jgi:two-component SAPR family response regulator
MKIIFHPSMSEQEAIALVVDPGAESCRITTTGGYPRLNSTDVQILGQLLAVVTTHISLNRHENRMAAKKQQEEWDGMGDDL